MEMDLNNIDINEWANWALFYGMKVAFALIILIGGWIVAKILRNVAKKYMMRAKIDATLSNFLSNILYSALLAFVVIATLNKIGIQTASLIAVIGAAGLAIGLALQGSLSNFAAGVMIILFQHFKVGDFIETGSVSGTVENLDIFNTTLRTPDNQKIIVPNSNITTSAVINYSAHAERRINITIGIGYDDDIKKAKNAIFDVINQQETVLNDRDKLVAVSDLGDSSVNLVVRCWTKTEDYWNLLFALQEGIKIRLDAEGISIPYPQTDVHFYNNAANTETVA